MGKNIIWISQAYYYEQVHPWIFIIRGGIAETKETEDLRKQKKKEEKEKKKRDERKKKENREQDEKVEEALMMEVIDEEWIL